MQGCRVVPVRPMNSAGRAVSGPGQQYRAWSWPGRPDPSGHLYSRACVRALLFLLLLLLFPLSLRFNRPPFLPGATTPTALPTLLCVAPPRCLSRLPRRPRLLLFLNTGLTSSPPRPPPGLLLAPALPGAASPSPPLCLAPPRHLRCRDTVLCHASSSCRTADPNTV